MNSEKFPELIRRASSELASRLDTLKEHAEHFVTEHVEAMKASGEAVELSDDEVRLLRAYRSYIARTRPGAVFSWRTPVEPLRIVTPPDVAILRDPQDVSV